MLCLRPARTTVEDEELHAMLLDAMKGIAGAASYQRSGF